MNILILRSICCDLDRQEIEKIQNKCIELCETPPVFCHVDKDPVEACKNLDWADIVINVDEHGYTSPPTMTSIIFQLAQLTKKTIITVGNLETALAVTSKVNPRK